MSMFRITLTIATLAIITSPLLAQQKQAKRPRAERLSAVSRAMLRIDRLHKALKTLELSDEQTGKMMKIHEDIKPQMEKVMGQLKEIMTEEQMSAAKETAAKAKEAGTEGMKFFRTVEAAVKLTDVQKKAMEKVGKEINAIQKDVSKKAMEILTKEQQAELKKKITPRNRKGRAGKQRPSKP